MTAVGCIPHGTNAILIQIIFYFCCSFLGFFVVIPIGITLRNFHGACILFAEIIPWKKYMLWPWNEPSCLYVLYMNLAINVFYSTFMGLLNSLIYSKKYCEKTSPLKKLIDWNISYILRAFNPIFLIINFCIMFFEVAGASILTSGLADFCNRTETFINRQPQKSHFGLDDNHFYRCKDLGKEDTLWKTIAVVRGTTQGAKGHSFYGCLIVASLASWILFMIWFAHFFMNVLMTCRVCSCEVAEEKKKPDKTQIIAQRRSRLATPIATPGGFTTPSRGLEYIPENQYSYQGIPRRPEEQEARYNEKGSMPPPSPEPSTTPPKNESSFAESVMSPRQLPKPKQKKLYTKKSPSNQEII